jgi:hypothetical protein
MRDLAKDSRWLQRQEPNRDNHISVNFYRAYDWLNQAIRAEAEVERLQKVYAITNESWKKQVEELALLRKLAQATWEYFNDPEIINDADIEDALAEYEAWKEEAND